jgi:hypothetical protein
MQQGRMTLFGKAMTERAPVMVAGIGAAALGLVAVVAPVFVLSRTEYPAPLFPWVRSGIEGFSLLSAFLLFASGVLLGFRIPKYPLFFGMCTMAAFPLIVFAEMAIDSKSHNLWPFEFLFYGVISLVAVAGAYVGKHMRGSARGRGVIR